MKKSILLTVVALVIFGIGIGIVVKKSPKVTTKSTTVSESLWKEGNKPNKIVVISDLHLGANDKISQTVKNRKCLVNFLDRIQQTKDVKELVIAGDFLDDWVFELVK